MRNWEAAGRSHGPLASLKLYLWHTLCHIKLQYDDGRDSYNKLMRYSMLVAFIYTLHLLAGNYPKNRLLVLVQCFVLFYFVLLYYSCSSCHLVMCDETHLTALIWIKWNLNSLNAKWWMWNPERILTISHSTSWQQWLSTSQRALYNYNGQTVHHKRHFSFLDVLLAW